MPEFEELLRLAKENNEMLKEILSYVREQRDPQNIQNDWQREMFFNILSDLVANRIQGTQSINTGLLRR